LQGTNTSAYYENSQLAAVKSFITLHPEFAAKTKHQFLGQVFEG
jgi:hypothetical protein